MRLPGTRATMLGAGGAARSVAVALASAGVQVTICGAPRAIRRSAVAALTGAAIAHVAARARQSGICS